MPTTLTKSKGRQHNFRTGLAESGTSLADPFSDAGSVQMMYRPVVAEFSERGQGRCLDRNRLPAYPDDENDILEQSTENGRWWNEQLYRCKYGWTAPDGLWFNPVYYFYLNFVTTPIKRADGSTHSDAPLYSDSDHEVFDWIYWLMFIGPGKTPQDGIITKGRRKHWSYITHCGFFMYYFCIGNRGDLGICYDNSKTREEGQRLFEVTYGQLPRAFQHQALDRSKDGQITAADVMEEVDFATGKIVAKNIPKNTIVFRETDKTPDALRGMNLCLALIDEAGKYRKLKKVISATVDCLREGTKKHGTMLVGGTSDAIDNKCKDYERQWKIAGKSKTWRQWFVPAWKVAPPNWDAYTGQSLRVLAETEYLTQRKDLLAAGDSEGYFKAIQENPLKAEECFHSATLSNYDASKIYDQGIIIRAAGGENIPVRGRMEYILNGEGEPMGAYFVADTLKTIHPGNWLLHPSALDPLLGQSMPHLHVAAVDDVYKDPDEIVDSDSLCAMTVYRRPILRENTRSNLFVATYLGRPPRALFAREVHKMMLYFKAKTMIENNDVFLKGFLLQKQMHQDLIWINNQVGMRNSDESVAQQELVAHTWMDDHGLDDVWFENILDGFKVWRQANTDIGSCAHMTLVAVDALKHLSVRMVTPDNPTTRANVLGDGHEERGHLRSMSVLGGNGPSAKMVGRDTIGVRYPRPGGNTTPSGQRQNRRVSQR